MKYASDTVTAIYLPAGIEYKLLSKTMREDYQITITSGQGALDGKAFRIGHLGWVNEKDMGECMQAPGAALAKLGYKKQFWRSEK